MSWILTNNAVPFSLLNPAADMVVAADLAHALSNVCRFNGHSAWHYSVAQHSLLVADLIALEGGSAEEQLAGLLHDSTEAYISDLTRPLKLLLAEATEASTEAWLTIIAEAGLDRNKAMISAASARLLPADNGDALTLLLDVYHQIELRIWTAICERFDLNPVLPASVKRADRVALATERRDLLPDHPAEWECLRGVDPIRERIPKLPQEIVRQHFHDRLLQLLTTTHRQRCA
ncbi:MULTISPECIES: phosphohydrolase [unclassified Pseudomonas]|uniref:phosphohydrolase n=1 Tax=unclassified Pseudomonas TaxID=196821 RepID=UPI002448D70C|nr:MULTISPECIES: phosphohydrolase [unclassified Pseudomonas]MDH0894254.1 phosphohydrolase [Pseudomonas sp. GD03875]MDH1063451.1 phosphohydrolase [Pseudomonas sp. GD03985]